MKKITLFIFALFMSTMLQAFEKITFTCNGIDDMPVGHGNPKSPIQAPTVCIEDYTLLFAVDHPEYVLNIKDEDDNVVYTTVVYSSLTQVILPSTLSGDYQIELVMGNWLFTGWINL